MITQDYINGYVAALNSMEQLLKQDLIYYETIPNEPLDSLAFKIENTQAIIKYIENIKKSYKLMVKQLNKTNS